jgi:hypothetical protein
MSPDEMTIEERVTIARVEEKVDAVWDALEVHERTSLSAFDEADKRFEQRFVAQQEGLKVALVGQEKLVSAALEAADRAVTKAEIASDKRFEAVNEAADRAQKEHRSALEGLRDELQKGFVSIAAQQNTNAGKSLGSAQLWGIAVQVLTLLSLVFVVAHQFG